MLGSVLLYSFTLVKLFITQTVKHTVNVFIRPMVFAFTFETMKSIHNYSKSYLHFN